MRHEKVVKIRIEATMNTRKFEHEVHIDYYEAERALLEHYKGMDVSRSRLVRVLALANAIAAPKTLDSNNKPKDGLPNGTKHFGWTKLREIMNDTEILLELIKNNPVVNLHLSDEPNADGEVKFTYEARVFKVEDRFIKSTTIELNEEDDRIFTSAFRKQRRNGDKHYTSKKLYIDIPRDVFINEVSEHLLSKEPNMSEDELKKQLKYQWKNIQTINKTGKAEPRKSNGSRCSSLLTTLSKPVDPYILFDGERTISIDQHATYFTILPSLMMMKRSKNATSDYFEEIERLKSFIIDSPNIYKEIANSVNSDDKTIKLSMNKYLCDPNNNRAIELHTKIDSWFKKNFPLIRNRFRTVRLNGGMSYGLMEIESDIFAVSRRLNEAGIDCITKFDEIRFLPKDLALVSTRLEESFKAHGVSYKGKVSKVLEIVPERKTFRDNIESSNSRESRATTTEGGGGSAITSKNDTSPVQTLTSPVQKVLDRASHITILFDGRYRVSLKNRKINSRKNETLEQFRFRVYQETGTTVKMKEN